MNGFCNRYNTYTNEIFSEEDLGEDIFDTYLTKECVFCKYKECVECGCFEEDGEASEKEEVE